MKTEKNNTNIKNHFQLIYQAFHRIVQKLPHSTNYLWHRVEENNLDLWKLISHQSSQRNNLNKIKIAIENIISYLSLLMSIRFLPDKNFHLLIKEYNNLLSEIISPNDQNHKRKVAKINKSTLLKNQKVIQRQERIIKFLQQREKTAVGEILMLLPQVSKRTIYRDLNNLAKKGVLKKEISKANSKKIIFYQYTN